MAPGPAPARGAEALGCPAFRFNAPGPAPAQSVKALGCLPFGPGTIYYGSLLVAAATKVFHNLIFKEGQDNKRSDRIHGASEFLWITAVPWIQEASNSRHVRFVLPGDPASRALQVMEAKPSTDPLDLTFRFLSADVF